jgi:hypothetical protein
MMWTDALLVIAIALLAGIHWQLNQIRSLLRQR